MLAIPLACGALAAAPAASLGSTGGAGLTPPPGAIPVVSDNGNATVSTSGDGLTLEARASGMLRRRMTFIGTAPSSLAGQTVEIERLGHETAWTWAPTVSAVIGAGGRFEAVWRIDHIGQFSIRAVLGGPALANGPAASVSPATVSTPPAGTALTAPMTVTVYRRSYATQYGPGFFGSRTACGERLHRDTIGVANRTLPCGTQVAIYYHGETMVVPVIDRGPYAHGADWDLTTATAAALGITSSAEIGAVSLPRQLPGQTVRRPALRARRA